MGKISIKDGVQMQNLFIFDKIEEMNVSHEHSDEHSHDEKDTADLMKDQAEKKQRIQQMIALRMKQKMVDFNQRQEEEGNKPSWIRKKFDDMSLWYYEVRTQATHQGINYIIFNPDNQCLIVVNILFHFVRVISSYFYALIATLRLHPDFMSSVRMRETLPNWFESIFGLEMVLKFMTALPASPEQSEVGYIRDFVVISQNYWHTNFAIDFIPLVPLQAFNLNHNRQYLFYGIKVIRLI